MNILFVTHATSLTGAPRVLLNFLKWLKEHHPEINSTVLDLECGGLKNDFISNCNKYIALEDFKEKKLKLHEDVKKRILRKIGFQILKSSRQEQLFENLAAQNFDLIYANSALSIPISSNIKKLTGHKLYLLAHVHEMSTILKQKSPYFANYKPDIDYLIAASKAVGNELISNFSWDENKIEVIYEFIEENNPIKPVSKSGFIVGGAGTVHWRKGSDLFIQIANYIKENYEDLDIKFEWVGFISESEKAVIEADITKAGLRDHVTFIGEQNNPFPSFSRFDVFLLSSREDPFPLVAIEIGNLGKPIICFDKATGTQEILVHGGGEVVPYLNIASMAEKIVEYYKDRDKLKSDGFRSRELFSQFTSEKQCPRLYSAIKSLMI